MDHRNWSVQMAENVMKDPQSLLKWHYETGCILKAIEQVWLTTGNERYCAFIKEIMDALVNGDGKIQGYSIEEYNLDMINTGKLLFRMYAKTGEVKYLKAIDMLVTQMKGHPRTSEGGFWHKKIYPYQMWLDGLYMASPFLAEYAKTFDKPEFFNDVVNQILLLEKHTRDPITGLLYHGWNENKEQQWADQQTGCSPHFWGRAIGWYTMAIVDILDFIPMDHPKRGEIIGILYRLMNSLKGFQDQKTGLWYQVLDQKDRDGNYLEASASAMFVYVLLKGIRLKYLDRHLLEIAQKGYNGIITYLIKQNEDGDIELHNICGTAGLGGDPYRDGSFEYYIGEERKVNDHKGIGPLIIASVEYEKIKG